jgi:hypothetical protein
VPARAGLMRGELMNVEAHFESLTREFEALQSRVWNLIATQHWQTDGEWKESVLRSILRRYLPSSIEPLRGFVVTPDSCTGQIDLLLYDNRKPVLFRDGDLVFVTPDAVLGIAEIKSRISDRTQLKAALESLADDAEVIHGASRNVRGLFAGLFSYQTDMGPSRYRGILENLQLVARGRRERIISHVSLGCSDFSMFWEDSPDDETKEYRKWHSYELHDLAPGYFISNLIYAVSSESVERNCEVWFPKTSKELRRRGAKEFKAHDPGEDRMTSRDDRHDSEALKQRQSAKRKRHERKTT